METTANDVFVYNMFKELKLIDRLCGTRWTPPITDKQTIPLDW